MISFHIYLLALLVISKVGVLAIPVTAKIIPTSDRNIPPQCFATWDVLFGCVKDYFCEPADHQTDEKCLDESGDWCFEDFGCPVPWVPTKIHDSTFFEWYTNTGTSESSMATKITLNPNHTFNMPDTLDPQLPLKIIIHGLG